MVGGRRVNDGLQHGVDNVAQKGIDISTLVC